MALVRGRSLDKGGDLGGDSGKGPRDEDDNGPNGNASKGKREDIFIVYV